MKAECDICYIVLVSYTDLELRQTFGPQCWRYVIEKIPLLLNQIQPPLTPIQRMLDAYIPNAHIPPRLTYSEIINMFLDPQPNNLFQNIENDT